MKSHKRLIKNLKIYRKRKSCKQPRKTWALFDTKDNYWLGVGGTDQFQVRTFVDEGLAQIAAQVVTVQLGWIPGRIKAVPYQDGPFRKVDEVPVKVDALSALKDLEEGRTLG